MRWPTCLLSCLPPLSTQTWAPCSPARVSHALLSSCRCAECSASPSHLRGAARPPPHHQHVPLLLLLRSHACRLVSNFVRLLQCWATSQTTSGVCFGRYSVMDRSSSLTQNERGSPGALIRFFFLVLASESAQGSPSPSCYENTHHLSPFQVAGCPVVPAARLPLPHAPSSVRPRPHPQRLHAHPRTPGCWASRQVSASVCSPSILGTAWGLGSLFG